MAKITILNGPNLNLLGVREPGHYGNKTLSDIQASAENFAQQANHQLNFYQNNAEHEIVEHIHQQNSFYRSPSIQCSRTGAV